MTGNTTFGGGKVARSLATAFVSAVVLVAGLWIAQPAYAVPTGEPALDASTPDDSAVFRDVSCEGSIVAFDESDDYKPSEPTEPTEPTEPVEPTEPEEPEIPLLIDNLYQYTFNCDKDVWAYSIISNRDVTWSEAETKVIDPAGDPVADFFCVGSVPSFGPGCYGRVGGSPARQAGITAGNTARGKIALDTPICRASSQPQFWVVVMTELGSYNDADTTKPPVVRGPWIVTSEPFPIDTSKVDCKRLTQLQSAVNKALARKSKLYERALKTCSKAKGKKARSKACTRATKAARKFRA